MYLSLIHILTPPSPRAMKSTDLKFAIKERFPQLKVTSFDSEDGIEKAMEAAVSQNNPVVEMCIRDRNISNEPELVAYVDGSYDQSTKRFSYGMVILENGEEKTFNKSFSDPSLAGMRNVAGEIMGARAAME